MNLAFLIFTSLEKIFHFYTTIFAEQDFKEQFPIHPIDYSLPRIEIYDFIIVGGGNAGCVVASKLSKNKRFNVLLLEAGGEPPPVNAVPILSRFAQQSPETIYMYKATDSRYKSKTYETVTGKGLGGSTIINAMYFNRGSPYDYDKWANITGDSSWSYKRVLKWFKKLETYEGQYSDNGQHGHDGPIPVTRVSYNPGLSTWLKAGSELGYPNNDPSGPQTISLGPVEVNRKNGRRFTSYQAYLKPYLGNRKNLKIIKYARVNQVILQEKKAIGVSYTKNSIMYFAKSSKEVILSAGTYGSPEILLRSGIGPTRELKHAKVRPIVNLPVGKNLQEDPLIPLRILVNDTTQISIPSRDLTLTTLHQFLKDGEGPFSTASFQVGQAFLATERTAYVGYPGWSDINIELYGGNLMNLISKPYSTWQLPENIEPPSITLAISLSRLGKTDMYISLNPSNISNQPVIQFNLLPNSMDLQVYIDALNKTIEIFEETNSYKKIRARFAPTTEQDNECNKHHVFRSDAYWKCFLIANVIPNRHPVGTCRMGRSDDPNSVVDSKLRVIGIDGLRVIDASIMPTNINTNPQAAVYMIAEKGSAHIWQDWTKSRQLRRSVPDSQKQEL